MSVELNRIQLLLVEDNPGDASLFRAHLADVPGQPYEVDHVPTLADAVIKLESRIYDLIFLDLSLPDSRGMETFRAVNRLAPETPIVVLSGLDDEAMAIRTVHEGAQDYLAKNHVDSRLLSRSIRYSIERKLAEDELARERDLLYNVIDNVPDRIFVKDLQSRFLKVNRSLAKRFHFEHPRLMIGKSDFDLFAEEHARAAWENEQRILKTGEPELNRVEKETLPDGGVHWVITSKLPLRNKQGEVVGTFGISRDITDLKRAEEAFAAERNLLYNIIEHLPDYIYAKDVECRYTLDNEAHRRLLGVARLEDVLGRKVVDFFPESFARKYDGDDQEIVKTGKPLINHEEPAVDRLGNRRWHLSTKIPLRDHEGKVVGLVCITRDVTDQKVARQELEKANQELARSREELLRTLGELQVSHQQLKDAQGQLVQAEKLQSIGRLAAGVAHEVKNPLAVLRMGLDYLQQNLPSETPDVQQILKDMKEAIQRADSTILGLLDFARPRELRTQLRALNVVVEESLSMVRYAAKQSGVRLIRDLGEDLPELWIDPDKIKQVLLNVFSNAVQAMEKTGGTLTVSTRFKKITATDLPGVSDARLAKSFHSGESAVLMEAKDTGPGIPEDKLHHIFDPFFTTKEPGKGTGLGLTVTRKIVEMHGGIMLIRNRKSGGVAVSIWLKV